VLQIVRTKVPASIDQSDLITPQEAAKISGRKITTIVNLINLGFLPWYEFPFGGVNRARVQRYTSRVVVLAMPKEKRGNAVAVADEIGITA
jgi:hypothetical protein